MELLAFVDVASLRSGQQCHGVEDTLRKAYGSLGAASSSIRFTLADLSWRGPLHEQLASPGCRAAAVALQVSQPQLQQSLERRRASFFTLASSTSMSVLLAADGAGVRGRLGAANCTYGHC